MSFFSQKPEVICVGSTSLDIFFPTDEGQVIDTPEDVLSQQKIAFELGGKVLAPEIHDAVGGVAANVAQGLARLGKKVATYSCIGNDTNGKYCISTLKAKGVQTSHLEIFDDARTDLSAIVVLTNYHGERTIIHNRDANKRLVVNADKLVAPWVFVSSLNGDWRKNLETILQVKKDRDIQIAFNPGQHNLQEDPQLVGRVIAQSEALFVNKDEAREIVLGHFPESTHAEIESEQYLLRQLCLLGAKIATLTDGTRGAWAFDGKEFWYAKIPQDIIPVETTGAGDAFASGFFAGILEEKSLQESLSWGMSNSQSVIQYFGAEAGLLNFESMQKYAKNIDVEALSL